jgi:hypothetical protein
MRSCSLQAHLSGRRRRHKMSLRRGLRRGLGHPKKPFQMVLSGRGSFSIISGRLDVQALKKRRKQCRGLPVLGAREFQYPLNLLNLDFPALEKRERQILRQQGSNGGQTFIGTGVPEQCQIPLRVQLPVPLILSHRSRRALLPRRPVCRGLKGKY